LASTPWAAASAGTETGTQVAAKPAGAWLSSSWEAVCAARAGQMAEEKPAAGGEHVAGHQERQ
jgi:hypothetical protein